MGNVRLYCSTSGYTELAPPAVAPDGVLSLPSGTGTLATQDYAAGAGGLVHINTETVSAVSSVSMTSQLSATYENYFVVWSLTSSTDASLRCRVRSGSTDNTATNYDYQYNRGSSTSTNFGNDTNQTSFLMSQILSSGGSGHCLIASPNLAQNTLFTARGGHALQFNDAKGVHDVATAFDGLTFFMASGTMTGTIRLYGYAN